MVVAALQTILDRIETWPPEQQERAAEILEFLDEQSNGADLQVSDEDQAEIDRRIADVDAPSMSLKEFRAFINDLKR